MATGIGKSPALLARLATSGPGAFLAGGGGQDQDGDVLVLLDQLEQFLRLLAFADHPLRHDAGDARGARGVAVEHGVGLLMRFRAHDVGDAEPLLVAVLRSRSRAA